MSKNSPPFQEDMHIRRTKKLIWEALLSLLEKQTFAPMSVKAICEQALVHRATFYSHFTDKYALMERSVGNAQGARARPRSRLSGSMGQNIWSHGNMAASTGECWIERFLKS